MLRLLLLICLASLLLIPSAFAAEEEGLPEVRNWQRETLAGLSSKARKEGYDQFVKRCLLYLGWTGVPQAELDALSSELLEGSGGATVSSRKKAKLDKEFRKYRTDAARKLATLAAALEGEDAMKLAREARRLDPENQTARQVLGQVRVKAWGYVSAEDAKRLKEGLLPVADGWVKKAEAAEPGRFVVVSSDHWKLLSRLPLKRTFELRDLLEAFHAKWHDDWEGVLPLIESDRPHTVYVFESKGAYETFLTETDKRRITGVPGQYSPELKRAVFYDVESHRTRTNKTSSMVELMLHECTHQIMHEDVQGKFEALEGAAAPNFWVHEGIAEFYGMHTLKNGELVLDRKSVSKMLRTPWLKERMGRTLTLTKLDTIGRQDFLSGSEQRVINYAHAGFVCAFLATGDHAAAFRDLVRAVYCEGNPPGLLTKLIAEDLGKLNRAFKGYFRRM